MRQIFAIGGGGSDEEYRLLHEVMLGLCEAEEPKAVFLPTAAGDDRDYIETWHQHFQALGAMTCDIALFRPTTWTHSPEEVLSQADLIYCSGGSTKNALLLWDAWGLIPLLRKAYERGAILGGPSAGGICWFEEASSDSVGRKLGPVKGLGWLKGAMTPHYHSEKDRKPSLHKMMREGKLGAGYAVTDGAALHFVDEELQGVVGVSDNAHAFQVELIDGKVIETEI